MPSEHTSSKLKPNEVASEAKKKYIPIICQDYADVWKTHSYLYKNPLTLSFAEVERPLNASSPMICKYFSRCATGEPLPLTSGPFVHEGDPVDYALHLQGQYTIRVSFICAADDKRPGGDWETRAEGYEERLCLRSTLSATLAIPGPESHVREHYPITPHGGIYSENVVVFRGRHDAYERLNVGNWLHLPVCSVPPIRRPKLTSDGSKYLVADERKLVEDKIRGALYTCVYNGCQNIVIGDFGLGNCHHNPPQELAEMWREVLLNDLKLRGRISYVCFVFEDPSQCTAQFILDGIAKKNKGSSRSEGKLKSSSSSTSGSSASSLLTDFAIFQKVFNGQEIQRYTAQRDPRHTIDHLLIDQ